jgi:hypothetical protein
MAFDTRAGAMLLYGGFDRDPANEHWRWTGATWIALRWRQAIAPVQRRATCPHATGLCRLRSLAGRE